MTRKAESWKKALCCCFTVQGLMQEIEKEEVTFTTHKAEK
jgi:hypothetical protein